MHSLYDSGLARMFRLFRATIRNCVADVRLAITRQARERLGIRSGVPRDQCTHPRIDTLTESHQLFPCRLRRPRRGQLAVEIVSDLRDARFALARDPNQEPSARHMPRRFHRNIERSECPRATRDPRAQIRGVIVVEQKDERGVAYAIGRRVFELR